MTTLDLGNKHSVTRRLVQWVHWGTCSWVCHCVTSLTSGQDSAAQDTETQDLPNAKKSQTAYQEAANDRHFFDRF